MKRCFLLLSFAGAIALQAQTPDRAGVMDSLRRGVEFFRTKVAVEGTYLWMYSEDLALREGEGVATATQGWNQPPGTPSVGMALLHAFEATGDAFYLDAARATGAGLLRGQLKSGGWTYHIDFDPKKRGALDYRHDGGGAKAKRISTLDDDTTQASLRFLMRLDRALKFADTNVHEGVIYALDHLIGAQYPNGAWPQGFEQPPDPAKFPVLKATFRDDWPHAWPGSDNYWFRYTCNDGLMTTLLDTLFEAGRIYGTAGAGEAGRALAERCRVAALKGAGFILLAQLPEPQPAWAQQYDFDMHPAWARKFEPPAVTGGESQGLLRTLLQVYLETGDPKYLEPVPRAIAYLQRSRLPDGRLARFYAMKTNQPLYFTVDYKLTDSDADMPTHYSFKIEDDTERIAREYERIRSLSAEQRRDELAPRAAKAGSKLEAEVRAVLAAQDVQGRWVEGGGLKYHRPKDESRRVIKSATFIRHIETLSRYLEATRP